LVKPPTPHSIHPTHYPSPHSENYLVIPAIPTGMTVLVTYEHVLSRQHVVQFIQDVSRIIYLSLFLTHSSIQI